MKNGRTQLVAILLAMIIALGCGVGGGIAALKIVSSDTAAGRFLAETLDIDVSRRSAEAEAPEKTEAAPATGIKIETQDYTIAEAIAEKVLPSVVGISTVFTTQGYGFWGNTSYDSEGVGTGVIVDPSGYILTNSHVVNDGDAKSITVSLYDNTTVEGEIIWCDSTLDLAIVKINKDGLVAAELGDSDELSIGSYAAAIGNPLGLQFERSMSQGIISGLHRTISVSSSSYDSSATTMEDLIQTDASINGGNSGGPLLNSKGQVVGINTAKASNGEGLGFAIPINAAKPIIEQVIETGSVTRPYIGISGAPLQGQSVYSDEQLVEMFGTSEGIYVSSLLKGGGAEAAGIKPEDIIIKLNGTPVSTMNKLNTMLIKFKPGDTVEVTVLRDKQEMTFNVVLTDGNHPM